MEEIGKKQGRNDHMNRENTVQKKKFLRKELISSLFFWKAHLFPPPGGGAFRGIYIIAFVLWVTQLALKI